MGWKDKKRRNSETRCLYHLEQLKLHSLFPEGATSELFSILPSHFSHFCVKFMCTLLLSIVSVFTALAFSFELALNVLKGVKIMVSS